MKDPSERPKFQDLVNRTGKILQEVQVCHPIVFETDVIVNVPYLSPKHFL